MLYDIFLQINDKVWKEVVEMVVLLIMALEFWTLSCEKLSVELWNEMKRGALNHITRIGEFIGSYNNYCALIVYLNNEHKTCTSHTFSELYNTKLSLG